QVEGLGEKYGMEFRAPRLHETPNEWLVARHRREIVPLLHDRESFASAARFRLFRVRSIESGGGEAHDVLAYGFVADGTVTDGMVTDGMDSDGRGACIVAFNNSPVAVSCAVAECEPFTAEEAGAGASTSLAMPLLAAL